MQCSYYIPNIKVEKVRATLKGITNTNRKVGPYQNNREIIKTMLDLHPKGKEIPDYYLTLSPFPGTLDPQL